MTKKPRASPSPSSILFAMTETPVIRSNQLTISEKAFYTNLKSYFYKNSPYSCRPSLTTLAKDCNLSRASIYRLKDSLEAKGLIKYESGRGRHNTNSYQFPLVTGSVKEKAELLIFLNSIEKVSPLRPFNPKKVSPLRPEKELPSRLRKTKKRDDPNKNYDHRERPFLSQKDLQELKTKQFVVKGKAKDPIFNPQEISNLTPRFKTKTGAGR